MTLQDEMMKKIVGSDGFIAALDQSGGSTPKALKQYGVTEDSYDKGEKSMFDKVHEMRTRIITSKAFNGDRILGAILFEDTMDREIEGIPTAQYLWEKKHIVPFLKIDKSLESEENDVQLMKAIPDLTKLCNRAQKLGVFGTKMRSVINSANSDGIKRIVDQQFDIAREIMAAEMIPIIEPEVNIHAKDKEAAEDMLKERLLISLDQLKDGQKVMLKLTIPTKDNLYKECIDHPNCLRVVALSGGYSREEANDKLRKQKNMVASFSRALAESLHYSQTDEEFEKALDDAIASIFEASKAG